MIPDHFYMTNLGIIVYAALFLPTVLVFLWSLWRQTKLPWKLTAPLGLVLITLPFWDVYMIGRDADRLCKSEAGLHVYKTVEAVGVAGYGAEYWLNYGFKYVEHMGIGPGKYSRKYRDTLENGEIVSEEIEEFTIQFDNKTGDNHKVVTKSISRSSHVVIDRETKEVLGDWVFFNIYPGLFDGILMKITGSGPVLWHCGFRSPDGNEIGVRDLVKATIHPKSEPSQ